MNLGLSTFERFEKRASLLYKQSKLRVCFKSILIYVYGQMLLRGDLSYKKKLS